MGRFLEYGRNQTIVDI